MNPTGEKNLLLGREAFERPEGISESWIKNGKWELQRCGKYNSDWGFGTEKV